MSTIKLGNLTIEQMESRMNITFPDDLKNFLHDSHQAQINGKEVAPGKWHCFDIPFMLVCGDRAMAQKVYDYLKPFNSQIKGTFQIGIARD